MTTALRLALCLSLSTHGCAALQPQLMDGPCRDPATGRFITCASGGSGDSSWALPTLGVLAGLGLIAGVVYLVVRSRDTAASSPSATQAASPALPPQETPASCGLPVDAVRVCLSARGYRFAIPIGTSCAPGSDPVDIIPLTCAMRNRPAYHACLRAEGGWVPVESWNTCASRGMADAPGDFAPPGRRPDEGVGPDAPEIPLDR